MHRPPRFNIVQGDTLDTSKFWVELQSGQKYKRRKRKVFFIWNCMTKERTLLAKGTDLWHEGWRKMIMVVRE